MQDYFVHDGNGGDGAVITAPGITDAAQRFIDIVHHNDPHRVIDPNDLNIFPIVRKNTLIDPVDTSQL